MKVHNAAPGYLVLLACISYFVTPAVSQLASLDRERARSILDGVASDIRKEYYDPKFHGIDWDAKVAEAKAGISKATSWNAAMIEIAVLTDFLNDSHTKFYPPQPELRTDYGWTFQLVGDRCFVTRVRAKSDAQAKGLKPGDQILTIDQVKPTRASLPKITYAIEGLSQQSRLRVTVSNTSGETRAVDVAAKITRPQILSDLSHPSGVDRQYFRLGYEDYEHRMRVRSVEPAGGMAILKLPEFLLSAPETEKIIGMARKHFAFILDLRGNPGGAVECLQYLLGGVFDHEVKIADKIMRSKSEPMMTKNRHDPFAGKLIVLVDAGSSSAAELFARVVQIEKRGTVIGDRTSGLVMESRIYPHTIGVPPLEYENSITLADLVMADGKSLEHTGVIPDEIVLPTADDLMADRDPALARAIELAGGNMTAEEAGKLFPFEWPAE
jgi:carboxyl-terminal processing protease